MARLCFSYVCFIILFFYFFPKKRSRLVARVFSFKITSCTAHCTQYPEAIIIHFKQIKLRCIHFFFFAHPVSRGALTRLVFPPSEAPPPMISYFDVFTASLPDVSTSATNESAFFIIQQSCASIYSELTLAESVIVEFASSIRTKVLSHMRGRLFDIVTFEDESPRIIRPSLLWVDAVHGLLDTCLQTLVDGHQTLQHSLKNHWAKTLSISPASPENIMASVSEIRVVFKRLVKRWERALEQVFACIQWSVAPPPLLSKVISAGVLAPGFTRISPGEAL